ncbi:MAG: type II toxin-antitoxin system RelE/ParE family toxin [Terricaulis sp.]
MRIVWRSRAEQELTRQLAHLAAENPFASERMRDRVERRVIALIHFPNTGRPARRKGVRELVISGTPYIAVYRVRGDVIEIIRFFHASQNR